MKIGHMIRSIRHYHKKKTDPIGYARELGVTIGNECKIIGTPIWGSEPWLISIGNHTEISYECAFITHDGATWVFRDKPEYRDVIKFGYIKIGNNCFIGARTTLLPGVEIEDDCIIAAGAVVTTHIPSGEVWGGVPARYICKTVDYADKCKKNTPSYDLDLYRKDKVTQTKWIANYTSKKD